jgi:hypothetical protein
MMVVRLLGNTCIESTAPFAMELGYHVTLVCDATTPFSHEMMHGAHELNGLTYAHSIMTTDEVIAALPAPSHSRENINEYACEDAGRHRRDSQPGGHRP